MLHAEDRQNEVEKEPTIFGTHPNRWEDSNTWCSKSMSSASRRKFSSKPEFSALAGQDASCKKQTDQIPLMSLGGQNTARDLTTTATEGGLGKQVQAVVIE